MSYLAVAENSRGKIGYSSTENVNNDCDFDTIGNIQRNESRDPENDDENIFTVKKEALKLYLRLMQNIEDDISSQALDLHHEESQESALKYFMIEIKLNSYDLIDQYMEALTKEIEEHFQSMKQQMSKTRMDKKSGIPPKLLQAIYNAANLYEKKITETCLNTREMREVDNEHPEASSKAWDYFELITRDMTECESMSDAFRKLLDEIDDIFERLLKRQQKVIFLETSRKEVESWFVESIIGITTEFEKFSEFKLAAIDKFEEAAKKSPADAIDIEFQRNMLLQKLKGTLHDQAVCFAVSKLSEAVEEYRKTMRAACESVSSETELGEIHEQALKLAIDNYTTETSDIPQSVAINQQLELMHEISTFYTKYKTSLPEMMLKQKVKIAQETFSKRMQEAVKKGDMYNKLQDQAKLESLANFDLATATFDREAVADYRTKLEEFFKISLEVADTIRISAVEKGLCCVCADSPATVVFQPCLHFNTCDTCAAKLTTCAMCRALIKNKLHVYH